MSALLLAFYSSAAQGGESKANYSAFSFGTTLLYLPEHPIADRNEIDGTLGVSIGTDYFFHNSAGVGLQYGFSKLSIYSTKETALEKHALHIVDLVAIGKSQDPVWLPLAKTSLRLGLSLAFGTATSRLYSRPTLPGLLLGFRFGLIDKVFGAHFPPYFGAKFTKVLGPAPGRTMLLEFGLEI